MRDDPLQDLLQTAAAELERTIVVPGELAQRVRSLDRKRRRNARRLAVLAPLVVVGVVVACWRTGAFNEFAEEPQLAGESVRPGTDSLPVGLPSKVANDENVLAATPEADPARLAAKADHHHRIAMRLIAMRKRDRAVEEARSSIANQEPDGDSREQIEVVAYRMIIRADGLRQAMRPNAEVLAIYRDVIHLFPKTHSAELARQRLTELGTPKGDI